MQQTAIQIESSIRLAAIVIPTAILSWYFVLQGIRHQRFFMMARTSRGGFVERDRAYVYGLVLAINLLGAISLTIAAVYFTLCANQIDGRTYFPDWVLLSCVVLAPAAGLPSVFGGLVGALCNLMRRS